MRKSRIEDLLRQAPKLPVGSEHNIPPFAKLDDELLGQARPFDQNNLGGLTPLLGNVAAFDGAKLRSVDDKYSGDNSGSSYKPGSQQIEENINFARQSDAAWAASNPEGPKENKREVGFYAVARWVTGLTPTVTVYDLAFGEYGEPSISVGDNVMFNTPYIRDDERLIEFHTHPFTSDEGFAPAYIEHEKKRIAPGVSGVVRHHNGHEWFGELI